MQVAALFFLEILRTYHRDLVRCGCLPFVELWSKFKFGPKQSGPLALRETTPSISSVLLIDEGVGVFLPIYTSCKPSSWDNKSCKSPTFVTSPDIVKICWLVPVVFLFHLGRVFHVKISCLLCLIYCSSLFILPIVSNRVWGAFRKSNITEMVPKLALYML